MLDAAGVRYRLLEYELDPAAGSFGLEAAEKLGVPPERVFKTLVVEVDGAPLFAVVPVAARLEPKALGKRARLVDAAAAERLTGYVKGVVNGGRRGLQLELDPRDLLALTGGRAQRLTSRG
jgi:Cys-tRNA(Pro)/Cys-tRNA(Cys) deacylase